MGPDCDCWLMVNDCCDDGCDCDADAMVKYGRRGRDSVREQFGVAVVEGEER